jgi:hypothetical protein
MASSGKRKTTMAKLNRERRLIERRQEKQARKDARKRASALDPVPPGDPLTDNDEVVDSLESTLSSNGQGVTTEANPTERIA